MKSSLPPAQQPEPPSAPSTPTPPQQPATPRKSKLGKLWVVVVIVAGLGWGLLSSAVATAPRAGRPSPFRDVPYFNPDPFIRLHLIFTSVEVALLLALVIVYMKIYAETRANFALGLVIVLSALLLQTIFSYPLVVGIPGFVPLGILPTFADILTIGAYTVFLYLSLE